MSEAAIVIRFVRSKGFSSDAIAWLAKTCMPFPPSHAECVTPEGKWLGQHSDGGMQAREAGYDHDQVEIMSPTEACPDGRCEIFVKLPVTQAQADAFYKYMTDSIGEPYDWEAIIGFADDRHHHLLNHAICSAKCGLGLRACEYFPWPITVPWHLCDPARLMLILSTHVEIPH